MSEIDRVFRALRLEVAEAVAADIEARVRAALSEAEARGRGAEREVVVGWLRGPLSGPEAADIAGCIERGEHLAGE